ncbi:MAG: hypothetical protein U0X91_17295 [Spirosomataceae bacterium]
MKTFRSITLLSAVALMGLWSCNSKQYAVKDDAEYDDLYGSSTASGLVAINRGDEQKSDYRNLNPDYSASQQKPATQGNYDYYDESYLSSRGINRNLGPNAGYNAGFSDGYNSAYNNLNWGNYWNNPWRTGWNSWGSGMSRWSTASMMLGFGYGMNSWYSPYSWNSPYGWNSWGSAYAWNDPFYSPYSSWGYPYSSWGSYGYYSPYSSWYSSPYSYYGSAWNSNVWYNGPSNNIQIVDMRRRPGTDYYNRVDRSTNAYNNNSNNSARYTNEPRRQGYDPTDRSVYGGTGTATGDSYYSRPRGGSNRSYEGYSGTGGRASSTYSSGNTQSSGYSSGTRGGATRTYGESNTGTYSNQRTYNNSSNNSWNNSNSNNSWNNSNSGRSSWDNGGGSRSSTFSTPSSSGSSSSGGGSSSHSSPSRGPR